MHQISTTRLIERKLLGALSYLTIRHIVAIIECLMDANSSDYPSPAAAAGRRHLTRPD